MKKVLSKNDLLSCKYEGPELGWTLNGEKLPDKIETELGTLFYMMGQGFVILLDETGRNFVKLVDFIKSGSLEVDNKEVNNKNDLIKSENREDKEIDYIKARTNGRGNFIPFGYFQCWECGDILPLAEKKEDGTCGCL